LDADDIAAENRLLAQFTYLEERPELCAVGCHVELFPREGLRDGRLSYESWLNSLTSEHDIFRDRFVECPLAHPSLFLRREALSQFGYRDMPWAEDYDLVLRLLGANLRLGVVPEKLVYWRDCGTRLSRTDHRYSHELFVDCKAHFLAQDWLKNSDGYILWGYGNTGRELCRALLRNGKRPSFIVEKHPGRIGQRIAGARVITPEELSTMPSSRERIVVSVAGAGPRDDVRQIAKSLSLVEGADFVCAA
jgi:hypothetical protein